MATLTIRLDDKLNSELRSFVVRTGQCKSDFAREALKRQLALARAKEVRQSVAPVAQAHGWQVDEDVFKEIS